MSAGSGIVRGRFRFAEWKLSAMPAMPAMADNFNAAMTVPARSTSPRRTTGGAKQWGRNRPACAVLFGLPTW
jgi:hypothetical protein